MTGITPWMKVTHLADAHTVDGADAPAPSAVSLGIDRDLDAIDDHRVA